jgi:hypothetical protein
MEGVIPTKRLNLSTRLHGAEFCKAVVLIFMYVRVRNFRPLLSVSRTIFPSVWTCPLSVKQMLIFVANLLFRTPDMRHVTKLCRFTASTFGWPSIFIIHKTVKSYRARVIRHTSLPLRVCSHWGFHVWKLTYMWRWKRPTKRNTNCCFAGVVFEVCGLPTV